MKMIQTVPVGLMLSASFPPAGHAQKVTPTVRADSAGKPISHDLSGIYSPA
jgi:hypothetical protein